MGMDPVTGSLVGGGLGLVGNIMGAKGAKKAANTQAQAADRAAQAQLDMYGQTRSDQMPWLQQGGGAVNQLGYLMGVNPYQPQTAKQFQIGGGVMGGGNTPSGGGQVGYTSQGLPGEPLRGATYLGNNKWQYFDLLLTAPPPAGGAGGGGTAGGGAGGGTGLNTIGNQWTPNASMGGFGSLAKPFGMADYQADPGYAFRLSEGQKALERSSAAKGGLLSGAAMKGMARYGQSMGAQEYGSAYDRYNQNQTNLYNRLNLLGTGGQQSAMNLGSAGQNAASGAGEFYTQAANAKAAGQGAQTAAWQTGLGNIGSLFGGGGGQYGGGYGNYGNLGRIDWFQ